jgi:hypothetical protein
MSPSGQVVVSWSNYKMEFDWEVQLGTAAPIGGRDPSNPSMKDVITIFVDGMRLNLSVKVRAHVVPGMTFTECSEKGFHYVLKIQDAEKFLGITLPASSGSTSGSGKMTPEEKAADDKACKRCGKLHETRDCNWPADALFRLLPPVLGIFGATSAFGPKGPSFEEILLTGESAIAELVGARRVFIGWCRFRRGPKSI